MSREVNPERFRLRIDTERPALYELNHPTIRVGTDPTCEVRIKRDRSVAPVHATFYLRDGEWCLRDEGSRAGIVQVTELAGAARPRIIEMRGLAPGQRFGLGETNVVFERVRRPGELAELFHGMVGTSAAMEELKRQVRFTRGASRVMVFGRTGTGKERVARAIHAESGRAGPFEAVNCAMLSEALAENELFGHAKGGFTGADAASAGLFRRANGGTLFLDEVGELSLAVQAKLLRVLEERRVRSVGGDSEDPVDVLVICGGQESPHAMHQRGALREDFLQRLALHVVRVPDLDERVDDIIPLVLHFTAGFDDGAGLTWCPAALARVKARRWPWNVRELRNFVELAVKFGLEAGGVGLAQVKAVERQPAFAWARSASKGSPEEGRTLAEVQAELVLQALRRQNGKVSRAAAELGVHRTTLQRMLKRLRLQ